MSDDLRFDRAALERYAEQAPAPPRDGRITVASMLALAAGNGLDAGSTIYALNHGARETNPVYGDQPSAAKVLAIKGAGTLAQYLILRALAKRHPKAANLTAKIIGGMTAGVGVKNLREVR